MKYKLENILKDPIDPRDYNYNVDMATVVPNRVDLRPQAGGIENQLRTGSCVANAAVSALEILLTKANDFRDLSRLFLYYNLREPYSHLTNEDKGSYLRDAFKSVASKGICLETTWPFIQERVLDKPDEYSYQAALSRKVEKYERIVGMGQGILNNAYRMQVPLAKGYPIIVSMKLGASFMNISGKLETHDYKGVLGDTVGGHAMNIVGYDNDLQSFIVENSWGSAWGDNGYCAISYQVMVNDMMDCWVCTEFAGYRFKEDFVLNQDPLVVGEKSEENYRFKGDRVKNCYMKAVASGGTPPYTYNFKWPSSAPLQKGDGDFFYMQKSVHGSMNSDFSSPFLCYVTDSGIPAQTVYQEFVIKFKNEGYQIIKDEEGITKLYIAYFNRVPDVAGLNYWLNSSLSLFEISNTFALIAFSSVYSEVLSNTEFVRMLYKNLLNLDNPGDDGVNYWVNDVASNSCGHVVLAMLNCITGDTKLFLDNKVEVCKRCLKEGISYDLTLITEDVNTAAEAIENIT